MMSKRETVLTALAALLGSSAAEVLRNVGLPARVPAAGLLILHDGVPGEPDVTLSPPLWHYQHRAEMDVFIEAKDGRDAKFDALLVEVGSLIAADRTLGGLCDWVEAEAPEPSELALEGATGLKAAAVAVVLHYSTTDPLN
ncbi:acyl-CoA transferase [Pseudorhodobacter sp.]|uniref:acyl-CoA transferase n=1 Tax=Pseudorhodobacter sp. TaxID=1934400 RepID=UPI0026475607|nr:acyl-CoA transferase [Pseudorhodobacter sp.]MDN5786912.1 acyl-CoA transferase [Pseudorhodobacter sp.]